MNTNVLVPVEQALVPFYGNEILAARLSDARIAASIGSFCEMLKLAKHGQMERIRRNKDLAEHLVFILVKMPNGPQCIEALVGEEAIRSWVMGIQVNRVAPEKRPLIRALKEEVYETLSRALLKSEPEQAAEPMPEPQAEPSQPAREKAGAAPAVAWDRLFEGLHIVWDALHEIRQEERTQARRVALIEEWLTSLDRRVAGTGQGRAAGMGWLPLLSEAHLADLRVLLRSLERATGRHRSTWSKS